MRFREHQLTYREQDPMDEWGDVYIHEYWSYESPIPNTKILWANDRRDYRRNWSRQMGSVDKVDTNTLLGLHINTVVAKYLHRLTPEHRTIRRLLDVLNIYYARYEDGGLVFIDPMWGYRGRYYRTPTFYVCPKNGTIKKNKPSRTTKTYIKQKTKPKSLRLKIYYEKKASKNKKKRQHRKEIEAKHEQLLPTQVRERARKENLINLQKLVSHGFDPKLSFRLFPTH